MTANAVFTPGGQNWKLPVRVATVGVNINLAAAPNVLDGASLAVGDGVLVKDQTLPAQNGIYRIQTLGTGANGIWVRRNDARLSLSLLQAIVPVSEGTTNADKTFMGTANAPIIIGVTLLPFIDAFPSAGGGGSDPYESFRYSMINAG